MKKFLKNIWYWKYFRKLDSGELVIPSDELFGDERTVQYGAKEKLHIDYEHYQVLGLEHSPEWVEEFKGDFTYKGDFFIDLENVSVVGQNATLLYKGKIVLASFLDSMAYLRRHGDHKLLRSYKENGKPKQQLEQAICLQGVLNGSYFHWIAEALPLLQAIDEQDYGGHIIVPKIDQPFVLEYLELFGFEKEQIIQWDKRRVDVHHMRIPSLRYFRMKNKNDDWAKHIYPKRAFDYIRNKVASYREKDENSPPKVYISREDANRGIENEDELVEMLTQKGFVKITLTELSVKEQIKLFANMQELVLPHGAALVNTIFSDSLRVLEFYPKNRNTNYANYFYQISSYYNHDHTLLACDSDDQENITVDIERLAALVGE